MLVTGRPHAQTDTCALRRTYCYIAPLPLRRARWRIQNGVRYIVEDAVPACATLANYEQYWAEREASNDLALSYAELVGLCAQRLAPGASVLDVGCGAGTLLRALQERCSVRGLGVDVSTRAVELARRNGVEARVCDVTRNDLHGLGRFDVATLFEVCEHIPDPGHVLLTLRGMADRIFVSVPNTGHYLQRLRLLAGRFPRQWIVHPGEHLRYWTLRDFVVMAHHLGFAVNEVVPVRGHPILARWQTSLFAESLFFVLRPRQNQ